MVRGRGLGLTKGTCQARCELFSHPIGGEVRLEVTGELLRSQADWNGRVLIEMAMDWNQQFEAKGCAEPRERE